MTLIEILAITLLVSAALYGLLGARLIAAQDFVANVPIGVLALLIGVWVLGGAVELLSDSWVMFSIGRLGHFVGSAFIPVAAYVGFREFIGKETPTRMIVMLLIIPVVSVTLAATNDYHQFMWALPAIDASGRFLTRPDAWGTWYLYVHSPYSYVVITAAALSLIAHSSGVAPAHRRGVFLLVAACTVPMAATVAYDLGLGPNTISYIPIVFAGVLPIYAWLIFGARIVEFAPLAYETVFQNMQDPVVVIDDRHRIIGLNHCAQSLLDINESGAMRLPIESVFGDGSTCVFEAIDTGKPQRMITSTGRFLHVQVSSIDGNSKSARGGRVLMFRDVSDVERAQKEVRKSEALLRTLIDHSVNGILRLRWSEVDDSDESKLTCIFANAAAGRFLGIDPDELVDCTAEQMVKVATNAMDAGDAKAVLDDFNRAVAEGRGIDVEVCHADRGEVRWLKLICEPVGGDFAATLVDVTDGKAREQQMESIAWSDPLTGVLNRRGFEREASRRLSDSDDSATGALLFIDLNGFKQINDRFGHEVGDELLRIAAKRLRKSLRSCDIIGRPGGDEFVALVPDVTGDIADQLAARLTEALDETYGIGEEKLRCAASIGLALYPDNANTLTGLLREADQAMYRAKARARDIPNIRGAGLLEKAM